MVYILAALTSCSLNSLPWSYRRPVTTGHFTLSGNLQSISNLAFPLSTTHHREGPSLSGRATGLSLIIRGRGLGFYPHLVGAGRESAADVIDQVATGLVVVKPALLGPVKVQPYVPLLDKLPPDPTQSP